MCAWCTPANLRGIRSLTGSPRPAAPQRRVFSGSNMLVVYDRVVESLNAFVVFGGARRLEGLGHIAMFKRLEQPLSLRSR